jgi:hypothetical protein
LREQYRVQQDVPCFVRDGGTPPADDSKQRIFLIDGRPREVLVDVDRGALPPYEAGHAKDICVEFGVLVHCDPQVPFNEAFDVNDGLPPGGHHSAEVELALDDGVNLAVLEPEA